MSKASAPFEWAGEKFASHEELSEILGRGYFKEGSAWGSIRQGWAVAVEWEEVARLIKEASGVPAAPAISPGRRARASLPRAALEGDLRSTGNRLWETMAARGFSGAVDALWARCEKSALDSIAKPAARRPSAKAPKTGKGAAKAGGSAGPAGPRRL
jgi:hypothetical protein